MSAGVADVVILGAGAAGLMCALQAGRRGRRVLVLDHGDKPGAKILISGGGRCNFTNRKVSAANYVSRNPHFCKSALSRFTPEDFLAMVEAHGIAYHERDWGQLFCDGSAREIVAMLKGECDEAGVEFRFGCRIEGVSRGEGEARFRVATSQGSVECSSLCVATGGLSIPKVGATGFGYELARQFGLAVIDPVPALDGFSLAEADAESRRFCDLAGIALECLVTCNGVTFREALLFTHHGLSGPVALQASLYWNPGDAIEVDFLPGRDVFALFLERKKEGSRATVTNLVGELLPARLAERLCEAHFGPLDAPAARKPLPQLSEKTLQAFAERVHRWKIVPSGTVGYSKAEVTRGGVDTAELSSKTMEARKVPGLYFIGEVVDVTGWLGGYNFQWAWASGFAAGQVV